MLKYMKFTANAMEQKRIKNLSNMSKDNVKFLGIHIGKFEFKSKV